MDEFDRIIVNTLQDGLPLCEQPFASLANELEIDEEKIVERIASLLASRSELHVQDGLARHQRA